MTSLVEYKNIEIARKFHNEKVRDIFQKIISKKIGYEKKSKQVKLNDGVIQILKKYPNLIINGKPMLLLKVSEKYDNLNFCNDEKEKAKLFFKYVYETHFQKLHGNKFLNKLNIDTCVYCNRNYTLDFKGLNNSRAQLDHWFPKADFPILALSFYNLIPSCHSCNHIKGEGNGLVKVILKNKNVSKQEINKWWKERALIDINHPYLKSNDFKFTWFYSESLDKTNVEFRTKNKETDTTLECNKTKEIYNEHSDKELKDLINLRYKYSDNYIDILINKTFKGILSKEEIYRMIFGIEIKEENYHLRPFSKFKHDIIEELKNIK